MGFQMNKVWYDIKAHAKVNLCLQVLGKRGDGYHDLLSFAGFTDFGDRLSVCIHSEDNFSITGPFAKTLEAAGGDSLCGKAVTLIREAGFRLPPLNIKLEKNIPLGGGLGGGSSDAAAIGSETSDANSKWVDVYQQGGRLVVFMAGAVEHEVLPAYAPRVALTAWFS